MVQHADIDHTGLTGVGGAAHNTDHQNGGGDEVSVAGLSGLLADGQTPLAHKTSHQDGGSDEISLTGLAGESVTAQPPKTHAASHDGGADDLNGLLTPNAHAASHQNGGADEIDVTGLTGAGGGGGVGNLWTMNKSASQTLTSNTLTIITFDTAVIDGGSSVIDLANDKFEIPATGFYLAIMIWMWETTPPSTASYMSARVNGADSHTLIRGHGTAGADRGMNGTVPLSLAAGDDVQMLCHPGGAVTPTARGNASVHLATSFTLVRIT